MPPKRKPTHPLACPGQRIRDLRRGRGWSQEDLALSLNTTKQRISAVETGRIKPSLSWMIACSAALEVSPATVCPELLFDVGQLVRGQVQLLRRASAPGEWTAEGTGIDGFSVHRTADLGMLIAGLVSQGIEVLAPALPPIE